jgi:hypothetical protein
MFRLGVLTPVVNVWYLSFYGGTERNSRNDIHIYSAGSEELGKALNPRSLPDNIELLELRGFGFGPDRVRWPRILHSKRRARRASDRPAARQKGRGLPRPEAHQHDLEGHRPRWVRQTN